MKPYTNRNCPACGGPQTPRNLFKYKGRAYETLKCNECATRVLKPLHLRRC